MPNLLDRVLGFGSSGTGEVGTEDLLDRQTRQHDERREKGRGGCLLDFFLGYRDAAMGRLPFLDTYKTPLEDTVNGPLIELISYMNGYETRRMALAVPSEVLQNIPDFMHRISLVEER